LDKAIAKNKWVQQWPQREQNALAIHMQLKPDLKMIDVSPSISRMIIATDEICKTLVPNSKVLSKTLIRQ
jgi:hypothetical protein